MLDQPDLRCGSYQSIMMTGTGDDQESQFAQDEAHSPEPSEILVQPLSSPSSLLTIPAGKFRKKHGFILQRRSRPHRKFSSASGSGDAQSQSHDNDSFRDSQSNIMIGHTDNHNQSRSNSPDDRKNSDDNLKGSDDDLGEKNGSDNESDEPELGATIPEEIVGFDIKFLKRFLKIHSILFKSLLSPSSCLFFFLIFIGLLEQYVIYQVGLVPSKFYKALGDKDLNEFKNATLISIGLICAVAMVKSTNQLILKLLTASWRKLLCLSLHQKYFSDILFYQLNVLDKLIDNPDQRITQDVDKFTSTYCEILPKILISPFVIAYYSYQAFSKAGWIGPVGCFCFFLIGSLFNRFAMSPVVRFIVEQEKREGDFRFIHMLVRVNSEPIAFMNASNHEALRANESLNLLVQTQTRLYIRQYLLNICINLFDYLGSIVSYIVLAIPIFAGMYNDLSPTDLTVVISQNAFVNMYLIYQFSQLVDLSVKVTEVIGVSHRIAQLIERLGAINAFWKDMFPYDRDLYSSSDYSQFSAYKQSLLQNLPITTERVPIWNLDKVSFSPPFRDDELVKDLSLTINAGESILVVGSSSAGKSSLFRILRGLWPPTAGRVERFYPPGPNNVYYCPQKPYLSVGTLREQICFPLIPNVDPIAQEHDEQIIVHYLKILRLKHLLDRVGSIDSPVSWSVYETLSPGEIQRLSLIRVFYHRPVIALLDESTSALPINMEELIYSECQKLKITTISIAHRESIRRFHDKMLLFDSSGGWRVENISS